MRKLLALVFCCWATFAWAQQPPYQTKFSGIISGSLFTSALIAPATQGVQNYITHVFAVTGSGTTVVVWASPSNQCTQGTSAVTLVPSATFAASSVIQDGAGIAPLVLAPIGFAICASVNGQPAPGDVSWGSYP